MTAMTEQEVFDRLLPLVQEVTGATPERIRMESVLVEDLGAESLDLLDLSFLIEEEFGVTFAADEFERQVRANSPDNVYERDGLLTEDAIARLRDILPEVPIDKLQPGLPKVVLPRVLNVAVFVHQIQRKLAESQEEAVA
jgi:acyl carrier protein